MRKEIEVKARLKDVHGAIERMTELGCELSDPIMQDDKLYYNFPGDYANSQQGLNFLRIRKQDGQYIFTIKQTQSNELDCIEYETAIDNPEHFEQALFLMGYKKAVELHKIRRKAKYKDLEICVDAVQDLGDYIEVEKIADDADSLQVQADLFDFLKTLGVKDEDREMRGYDTLMWLKNNK